MHEGSDAKAENGTHDAVWGCDDDDSERPSKKIKTRLPVDLELEYVLGDMPRKVCHRYSPILL